MCRITVITSLFNCVQYLESYLEELKKIHNPSEIEILLLHNAPLENELKVLDKYLPGLPFVNHIIIPERESLYATWNRGVRMAKGKYLTIWNVDDIRLPDSLSLQAAALDENPKAAMAYGNFVIVNEYGRREGRNMIEPEFEQNAGSFLRKHHIGCFPMWRKEIHHHIGFFDEQFKLVADLDFQIRVSKKYPLVKAKNKCLGYYLENTPTNLSSNRKLQRIERTALNLRYGNLDLLHLPYLFIALNKIKVGKYKWYGNYHAKKEWTDSSYNDFFRKLPLIFVSLFNLPLDTLRFIKYAIPKSYRQKIGEVLIKSFGFF